MEMLIPIITAAIAAIMTGLWNRRKTGAETVNLFADAAATLVAPLREEVSQLRERIAVLERENGHLVEENTHLRERVSLLEMQLHDLGVEPATKKEPMP